MTLEEDTFHMIQFDHCSDSLYMDRLTYKQIYTEKQCLIVKFRIFLLWVNVGVHFSDATKMYLDRT